MSLGFSNQVLTLAQVEEIIADAFWIGWRRGRDGERVELTMEDRAAMICEAANLPMMDVLAALQRLSEWRETQRDHPI